MSLRAEPIEDVIVRAAVAGDVRALEWDGTFRAHRALIEEAFARQERGEVSMIVADLRGELVGQIWIDFTKHGGQGIGVLWALRVVPRLQGLGIGTRLLREAEREVARRGLHTLELGVELTNDRARALYERLGYRALRKTRESFTYATPEGERVDVTIETWTMRKPAPRAGAAKRAEP